MSMISCSLEADTVPPGKESFGGMSIPDEAAALVFNASLDGPAAAIFKAENESPLFSQGGQLQVNV